MNSKIFVRVNRTKCKIGMKIFHVYDINTQLIKTFKSQNECGQDFD